MSIRATSSSSAISRLSRSASALTVLSMSFFCSSLSLSQRLSRACTKPLTPVSGERSSWATVATRSERSRSSRARPRPERSTTTTRSTGWSRAPSGRSRAVTSTSLPLGRSQDCSGIAVRVRRPVVGRGSVTQSLPSWSGRASTSERACRCRRCRSPSIRAPCRVTRATGRRVRDHHAVGQRVDDPPSRVRRPRPHAATSTHAGEHGLTDRCVRARRGVEAERGRGGQVEALGATVDRDRDPVVGQRRRARRAGPRPRCRTARRSARRTASSASNRSTLPVAVGGQHGQPGLLERGDGRAPSGSMATGTWNRLPTLARTVLRVVGSTELRPAPPRRRRPRRRYGSRCRRCRGPGRRRRRRPAGVALLEQVAERHVEEPADGHQPGGVTLSLSEASAWSSTSVKAAAAARPGRRTARPSRPRRPRRRSPATASASAPPSGRRQEEPRRRGPDGEPSLRASLTRAFPGSASRRAPAGVGVRPRPRPWAR